MAEIQKIIEDSEILDWIDENKFELRYYGTDLFDKSCFEGSCWIRNKQNKIVGVKDVQADNIRELITKAKEKK